MEAPIIQDGDTSHQSYESISSYPEGPSDLNQALSTNHSEDRGRRYDCSSVTSCSIIVFFVTFNVLFFAVSLSMIIVGGVYLYDCNAEDEIPTTLIVGGCFGCFSEIVLLCSFLGNDPLDLKTVGSLLSLNITCIVTCSVYVYTTNFQSMDSTKDDYCDHYLYRFAFCVVTLAYVTLGLAVPIGAYYIFWRRD